MNKYASQKSHSELRSEQKLRTLCEGWIWMQQVSAWLSDWTVIHRCSVVLIFSSLLWFCTFKQVDTAVKLLLQQTSALQPPHTRTCFSWLCTHPHARSQARSCFWRFWRGQLLCVSSFLWRDFFPLALFHECSERELCVQTTETLDALFYFKHRFPPEPCLPLF